MVLALCIAVMTAALLFGGATRSGYLSDLIVQLSAVPLLVFALYRHATMPADRRRYQPFVVVGLLLLIPVLQLVPLPAGVWTMLPNRAAVAQGLALAGISPSFMPLSLAPRDTWLAALSLIPPLGMYLGALLLTLRERRSLSLVVLAIGMAGVLVGLLQIAQGESSPLRFFDITNRREAVGFFANRNHFAAFTYVLTLLAGAWILSLAAHPIARRSRKGDDSVRTLYLFAGVLTLAVLFACQVTTRSRAGMGLMLLALMGLFLLTRNTGSKARGSPSLGGLLIAMGLGLILVVQFAMVRLLERFLDHSDAFPETRAGVWRSTIEAAVSYMPFGAGLGSFLSVYPAFEKTSDIVIDTYMNRAHNDYLEFWLEAGVIAPVVLVAFVVWLVGRLARLWQQPAGIMQPADLFLARAAALAVLLVSLHSLVDYPLRTAAVAVCFAFCCAMMMEPVLAADEEQIPVALPTGSSKSRSSKVLSPVDLSRGTEGIELSPRGPVVWPGATQSGQASSEPASSRTVAQPSPPHEAPERAAGQQTAPGDAPAKDDARSADGWPNAWENDGPPAGGSSPARKK